MLTVQTLIFILSRLDQESLRVLGDAINNSEGNGQAVLNNELMKIACSKGEAALVSILLRSGAEPQQDCLTEAVTYDRRSIVAMLLADGRIDPSADDNYALKITAKRCDVNTCVLLLEDRRVDPRVLEDSDVCGPIKDMLVTMRYSRRELA